ncbi:type III-B CRISPR-associated protein Cas10/Cmr2 [Nautilia lithotrophica]
MKKYTGISIGPIYKTLSSAKKTREIWGSSYLFSYVMKEIIKKLSEYIDEDRFITPYVENSEEFFKDEKIGKFHDRIIYEGGKNAAFNAIDAVVEELGDKFFKEYLKFYVVEDECEKPQERINYLLNCSELFYKTENYENEKPLKNWIDKKYKSLEETKRFLSLPEIAMTEIRKDEKFKEIMEKYYYKVHFEKRDEKAVFEQISKLKKIKPYYKYVAIVHADGDNLSKLIQDKEPSQLREISKKLFDFSKEAVGIIENYGGEVIYAGGDDLMFFAPVKNGNETIFDLVKNISEKYDFDQSTLSFGISITYYKFPMNEALEISRNLLSQAKSEKEKNSVAFKVIKHSGQEFGSVLKKHSEVYIKFLDLLKTDEEEAFLHSIYLKISLHKTLLDSLKADKKALNNFFDNFFNENHSEYKNFFEKLIGFIYGSKDEPLWFETIYSTLRFMKFLKGDK